MKNFTLLYICSGLLFLVVDMLWLNIVAQDFYQFQIGALLRQTPILWAAALFYLIYPAGLVVFVLEPGVASGGNAISVLIKGVFLGVLVYATYDLTNLATLKGWSVTLAVVDILWGGFVSGGASLATFLIFKRFFA